MARPPFRVRRLPAWIALCTLLVVALASFGLRWWRARSVETLRRELAVQHALPGTRPSHAAVPSPGRFWDVVGALTPELTALYRAQKPVQGEHTELWRRVGDGQASAAELPAQVRGALDQGHGLVGRVLAATRAELGGLPLRVRTDGEGETLVSLQHVARLASLEVRRQLVEGHADLAVDTCLDTLALGREVAVDAPLLGRMMGTAIVGIATAPCAAALDEASAERKERALAQLDVLAQGWPLMSRVLEWDHGYLHLSALRAHLSEAELASLPGDARNILCEEFPFSALGRWVLLPVLLHGLEELERRGGEHAAGVDLPEPERSKRVDAWRAALEESRNPLVRIAVPNVQFFLRRATLGHARLALLRLAVRADLEHARTGAWPELTEALEVWPGARFAPEGHRAELTYADPDDARLAFQLTLSADAH